MAKERGARGRMLRATVELLRAGGWQAATPAAVAERAGAGKMSLYRHFGGKDELVATALRELDEQHREWLFGTESGDPRDRLLGVFARKAQQAERGELTACPYVSTRLQLGEAEHPVCGVSVAHKRAVAGEFQRLLAELGHPQPDATGRALVMLLDGAIVHCVLEGAAWPMWTAEQTARTLVDH